jgi:hypothetical protein
VVNQFERVLWTAFSVAILLTVLTLLEGCASPHFMAGDALVCEQGGEYRESPAGVSVSCERGLRWTGPMSDNASSVTLEILKGALGASPGL